MIPARRGSKTVWLAPGCRLDRYDLLLLVAEGGMGLLWLARQQGKHGFDRIVAIKTILPKLASDSGFRRMFLDEARVVSRIEHPNVAQVLDLGEERGVLFLVMEWIDGESLTNVSRTVGRDRDAQIPVGILARVMVDVCAGLHAAHELTDDDGLALGVVHRDVSPDNLLVGFRGTTKVIDFGIAKARNRMAQDTSVGILKGKIAYMAPEQAMGSGVDRRSDVWSVGASMYRFLTGQVPYNASEPVAALRMIAEGRAPPPLPTTVPRPIRLVVEKAIEPDPSRRFATAHDVGAALEVAMRAADIYTTREDVAAFMGKHLGEARAMRTEEIDHAVRESRARMRVELAHTESISTPAIPIARDDGSTGSQALAAEPSDRTMPLEGRSGGPLRPSGRPTAVLSASQPSMGFDPAGGKAGDRLFGASDVPRTPPQEVLDSTRSSAGVVAELAEPTASVSPRQPRQRRLPRPFARWIAGTCLLGVLLAGGLTWRAARLPRPIGAPDVAAVPAQLPGPAETPMLAPLGTPAVQTTVSTGDPPASAPGSARPKDQRAPAGPLVETSALERGSADDLLERAQRARRAGRIGEAAALFAGAVEKAPANSEALTDLAEVDQAQGATAKAIVDYRRALAFNPRYLPARLGLADSLWGSGQRGEARAAYRSIVAQFPATMCPERARERAAGPAFEGAPK